MRFLLCLPALAVAAVTLSSEISDACGSYDPTPQVMLLSTHRSYARDPYLPPRATRRTFAVWGTSPVDDPVGFTWEAAAPRSYDNAMVATIDGNETPTELTLVGPSGSRIVSSAKQVLLRDSMTIDHESAHHAIELDVGTREDFAIAIYGRAKQPKWHALESLGYKTSRIYGLSYQFELRSNGKSVGTYDGIALGVLEVDGKRYLVVKNGAQARALDLPVTVVARA